MKALKRILFWFLMTLAAVNAGVIISGNTYIYRALVYTYVDIGDYPIFSNRTVSTGKPAPIPESYEYNRCKPRQPFRNHLDKTRTTALLVIRNDSVLYEEYRDDGGRDTLSNSFSVAKSIVSVLTGAAIADGYIKSVDQKVSDFIPEFRNGKNAALTIRHLLTMSAGFNWDERYSSLFSKTTKAYYGCDLPQMMFRLKVQDVPGKIFNYQSSNQIVLAYLLRKACGKSISEYAAERLWIPLGAEKHALWSLDHENGLEKAYCCFNATARDFSRIGMLYLNGGRWNGQQIIPEDYVKESLTPASLTDEKGMPVYCYGFSWWLSSVGGHPFFYARGILGQYIIGVPDMKLVIVRLGHIRPDEGDTPAAEYLCREVIEMIQNK